MRRVQFNIGLNQGGTRVLHFVFFFFINFLLNRFNMNDITDVFLPLLDRDVITRTDE